MNLQLKLKHGVFALFAATSVFASGRSTEAAIIAYYQFETDGTATAGPNLSLSGTATIVPGKFGNALDAPGAGTTGASVADNTTGSAGALRDSFEDFTVSFWLKPDAWSGTTRFITGKNGGSNNRGWYLSKLGDQKMDFITWQTNANSPAATVTSTSVLSIPTSGYTHIAATFSVAESSINLYANGIKIGSGTVATTSLNGINTAAFEIGGAANAGTSRLAGNFDDYVIADDFMSAEKIALINGLGQLAGVTMANNSDIDNVLNAYTTATGNAVAGGSTWAYSANVGGGNIIGTRGGSVGGGDAFIVLGTDGSGITIVPEPGTINLAAFGLAGLVWAQRRRARNSG